METIDRLTMEYLKKYWETVKPKDFGHGDMDGPDLSCYQGHFSPDGKLKVRVVKPNMRYTPVLQ